MGLELTLPHRHGRRPRVAGFSVVEVLIAAAIFLIIAVGTLPLFVQAMRSNVEGNDSTQVSNWARTRAEQFFQLPFNSSPATRARLGAEPDLPTLDILANNERRFDEYYSRAQRLWLAGTPPVDGSDPAEWTRTTFVRQYDIRALDDEILAPAEALTAAATASEIDVKEITVLVQSVGLGSRLGSPKRVAMRVVKSQ
jgi:type II secretory pathway pseudopilin PulG